MRLAARHQYTVHECASQPSTVYASFADPVITELGRDLDRQFAELVDSLGVEAGTCLGPPGGGRRRHSRQHERYSQIG